ncbi:hypothetical protein [Actibacterium ureilyticum]|nr:hypothetical protein [Actibacterium ureilyticum]
MRKTFWLIAIITAPTLLSACAPVVIGAAGAVAADEAIEQKKGGDGLF